MSINPKEIRIGNVLSYAGLSCRVYSLTPDKITFAQGGTVWSVYPNNKSLDGIPLTPEILERCGFRREDENWWGAHYGEFMKDIWITEFADRSFSLSTDHYFTLHEPVRSIHMLQNAWWIITGTELPFNHG